MNPRLPLSDDWQQETDEALGRWLVAAWVGHQADKAGISRGALTPEWANRIIVATLADEVDSAEDAALDNAIRKACNGQYARAGAMLREIVEGGAKGLVVTKYARIGINVAVGRKRGGKKAANAAKADANAWQLQCVRRARALLHQGKSPRELAGILAPQFGHDVTTIRRVLKKAGMR